MIKETQVPATKIERRKFCDVCGDEIPIGLACSKACCSYCGKDLCEKDIGYEEETGGDYRVVWCKKCWELGEQYRPQIEDMHHKIELMYAEWRSKCKCP